MLYMDVIQLANYVVLGKQKPRKDLLGIVICWVDTDAIHSLKKRWEMWGTSSAEYSSNNNDTNINDAWVKMFLKDQNNPVGNNSVFFEAKYQTC